MRGFELAILVLSVPSLIIVACDDSPSEPPAVINEAGALDAPSPPPDAPPVALDARDDGQNLECPSTYGAISPNQSCALDGIGCLYPEGRCTCLDRGFCGGAHPADAASPGPTWGCAAKRTDGCPDTEPTPGATCSIPSTQNCQYGFCCVTTYQCPSGTWTAGAPVCPP